MFRDFLISFKLRNTYKVNGFIYSLKQLPLIKNILPEKLYESKGLKILGNIISIIIEIISAVLGKIMYLLLMLMMPLTYFKTNPSDTFLHILTFLTIIGALLNTYMFNPSKDKYYAMILMRMNAKSYTISNYIYALLKIVIVFLPFLIIYGAKLGINLGICILIPFFVVGFKLMASVYSLNKYKRTGKATNENFPEKFIWAVTVVCLALAYGLPYIGIALNQTIFFIIEIITIFVGILCSLYIKNFNQYRPIYKQILTNQNVNIEEMSKQIIRESTLGSIGVDLNYKSTKKGFEYFNDLFVKRHKKILLKAVKRIALVFLLIMAVFIFLATTNEEVKSRLNQFLLSSLPYFIFIMYMINRGQIVAKTMFMNCDYSMLTYSFYKKPETILKLFSIRLKSMIKINLIPAVVIAIGLPIILYISGGTDNYINYIIVFTSIIAMSIFFSIHHLVVYYLLQPYNVNVESKSATYGVVNTLVYFASYFMIHLKLPIFYFGIALIFFSILYCIVSLILAYKLAPRTFKLRT